MKFLCLHGKGTNSAIFKSQTASFRAKLDPSYTFDFVEGDCPTTPPIEIRRFYSPPYRCYWEGKNVADIKASFKPIEDKLKSDGPYDGVMVFSQGAALIASYLLYLRSENQPLPFKCAIFLSGGVHCSVLEDLGVDVSPEAHVWDKMMSMRLDGAFANNNSQQGLAGDGDLVFDRDAPVRLNDVFGLDVLQPAVKKLQIDIPTVHIYGNKDPVYPLSRQLVQFCDSSCSRTYDHGEGHLIPRKREASDRIRALLKWAAEMTREY